MSNISWRLKMVKYLVLILGLAFLGGCVLSGALVGDAAFEGRLNRVKAFIAAGGDVDQTDSLGLSILQNAIRGESIETVQYLLEQGADVNHHARETGDTPLSLACRMGNFSIVEMLIHHGVDLDFVAGHKKHPCFEGLSGIQAALVANEPQLVELMLAHGAMVDHPFGGCGYDRGYSPLMYAIIWNGPVETLIAYGPDPNILIDTENGPVTPFYFAAERGDLELLEQLRSLAPPDKPELIETGLVQYNLRTGQVAEAKVNVANGANIQRKNLNGEPLLYDAVKNRQIESICFLHSLGCDPNEPSARGETPLMLACRQGYEDVVRVLLEIGADKNITRRSGSTARDMALEEGHLEIAELLRD